MAYRSGLNSMVGSGVGIPEEDEDDIYSGYNDTANDDAYYVDPAEDDYSNNPFGGPYEGGLLGGPAYDSQRLTTARVPGQLGAAAPGRLGTALRMGTAAIGTAQGVPGDDTLARPMTSVKAAGYSSMPQKMGRNFDPLNQAAKGAAPPLQKKSEATPEEQCREVERKVNTLLEESAAAGVKGDFTTAVEKAKEAGKRERLLCKQREQAGLGDQNNIDLTYAVCFNLAHQYHRAQLYTEALNAYTAIIKNKAFSQPGRLRVNMGNVYYEQKKYPQAIKMYRMALDQVPATAKDVRYRIIRNIGNAFVRLGQYQDAVQSYENIMEGSPDFQSGFNLVVCYVALGDKEKVKRSFMRLLTIEDKENADDELLEEDDKTEVSDDLRKEMRARKAKNQWYITTAAMLIAPIIEKNPVDGFATVMDALNSQRYVDIANEVEMAKAISFLKNKDFDNAISVFKGFERKEASLKARAATNLSFLTFLEGNLEAADQYSDMAVKADRYNARSLVNKGNCAYIKNDLEGARNLYMEAVGVEADCVEAIYNLGLVNKRLGNLDEALTAFKKLHKLIPDNVEVIYQVGNLYDLKSNYKQAIKWFDILNSRVMNDPGVLARLGAIHAKYDDEAKALHYYSESHRVYPVNMDVISWLGAFHVKSEVYEKAMPFFDLASKIQPNEVKWQLMVASCFRRVGALPMALAKVSKPCIHGGGKVGRPRTLVGVAR
eukprot:jgi/Mesvir1/23950/Mv10720-RA.2